MNIIENTRNIITKAKNMKAEELEAYKYSLFFIIALDLFGVYWYFQFKRLGIALMLFSIIALSVILILERNLPLSPKPKKEEKKMSEEKEEPKDKKEDKEEKSEDSLGFGMDFGLPNSEDYNKRLKDAIGEL